MGKRRRVEARGRRKFQVALYVLESEIVKALCPWLRDPSLKFDQEIVAGLFLVFAAPLAPV